MRAPSKTLITIGITDVIDMPDAGLFDLPCKIDTGADTSSIHCERIKVKEIDDVECLVFKLLDKRHPLYTNKEIVTSEFKEKKVKSSFGDFEIRYQVKLKIILFGKRYRVAFNLSYREKMKYPVLLGRRFLSKKFLVDVSQNNLSKQLKQP
ncbi:MAG: hypothetical protein ACI8SE_000154 [Bacteroidia bacterium]|jgi:hypothetical protein